MSMHSNHPFHLVNYSPWPLFGAISTLMLMTGLTKWFHQYNMNLLSLSLITTMMIMYQWWRDISRETTFQGLHTTMVINGMKWGMILFICSEILFFFSFFWSFFHSSLTPTIEMGLQWPPFNILVFNPLQIPLLNTMILLSSGVTITWSHHSLLNNNYTQTMNSLLLTIFLGIYFSMLQGYEYMEANFSISDSTYGTTFFMATGFHGLHVLIGTTFLLICLIRHMNLHFSKIHHFGFEAAAWYWHFVDIVWLFLYITIYWWGK